MTSNEMCEFPLFSQNNVKMFENSVSENYVYSCVSHLHSPNVMVMFSKLLHV